MGIVYIQGQIHMFINHIEKNQLISMKTDQENLISTNQAHSDICMKLVDILEIENSTLHKSVQHLLNKDKLIDDINK